MNIHADFITEYCRQNGTDKWDAVSDLIGCGVISLKAARNWLIKDRYPKLAQKHGAMTAYSILSEDYGMSERAVRDVVSVK